MEDCRKDKELKQSTCRYVQKCPDGWTRNKKFICRKTTRRLVKPKPKTKSKNKNRNRKSRVGNYITYTHPNGRKEVVQITKINENGAYELYIPSLANEVAGPDFQENEMVFYVYKTGMREKARVTKVIHDGEMYEVFLTTSQVYKKVLPIKLRKISPENGKNNTKM